ncbi:hypothetical protein HY339_02405 [Candidatus Gottesmanbacteria bacterium]|nr:hypothetical protein [Candidatus Gottesmanbacteria bacterium]
MTVESERVALCKLPLAERASLDELPALMQAYELGTSQAGRIHQGEAVCVQTRVGGINGCTGSFYERSPSLTLLDYAQMVIAAGVFLEELRDDGGCLEVVEPHGSNGSLNMKQIDVHDIDLHCVRAQLLGLLHALDGNMDDYRVVGIIGDALRNDTLNPKKRKEREHAAYKAMLRRAREE